MAVAGRKYSRSTLARCSAEDVDHFCYPCLDTGKEKDAQKYCVDCGEYLCKACSVYHLRDRASRNHQLVVKDKVVEHSTTQGSGVFTEKCPEHKQEEIKYFCPKHETLGCNICMSMYHRACEIDYIPEKCADMANSKEYRRTMRRLDLKLKELDEIKKSTKVKGQEIDKRHHNLLQEITKFRKEINDYLDHLQQKIQKEADKEKTEDKQIIQSILDGCNRLSSDIKKIQSTLQANETSGNYGQLYITVKQAQLILRSNEIKAEDGLQMTAQRYVFERNNSIMDLLSEKDAFGKLCLNSDLNTSRKYMNSFQRLTEKEDINIRTKSDKKESCITGCAVLSSKKLILADYNNDKLKLVNIYTKSVIEEAILDSGPCDIAVLSHDQIAVTMPAKKQVVIMTCDDRLSIVHKISINGECRGLTPHHGQLFVVCVNPLGVDILDKQCHVQKKISLKSGIFYFPYYLVVSENSKLLYISDYHYDCVVSITLQGEVIAVYKHEGLRGPEGMLMLDDGSLLVCCRWNGSIHHISGDLKKGQRVIDGLRHPHSICYNHYLHEVYIGSSHDLLTVLIPK